jgi:acetylornithine deacetylase/succinyl-diaminopimelate desuccinylase-like protein
MSTIKGGLRSNVSPLRAEAVIDIRIPLNGSNDEAYKLVTETLLKAGRSDVGVSVFAESSDLNYPPHWTSPNDRLSQIVRRNVAEVRGQDPIFIITFPSGDIRNYRLRGLPGVMYGTDPHNTGGFDEYITVDDLITVTKVYVGTILDYFGVDC